MTLKNAVAVLLKMIFRVFSFSSECCADFVVTEDSMQSDLFLLLSFAILHDCTSKSLFRAGAKAINLGEPRVYQRGPKFESVLENYKNSSKAIMPHSSDQLELFNELTFI